MFDALTRLTTRSARTVLVVAAIVFIVGGAFGGSLASRLPAGDAFIDPSAESSRANQSYEGVTGSRAAPGILLLVDTPEGARSEAGLRRVREISRRAKRDVDVTTVLDLRDGDKAEAEAKERDEEHEIASFVSKDGKKTYIAVFATPEADEAKIGGRLEQAFAGNPHVTVGGPGPGAKAIGDQAAADLVAAEQIAFPILFVLMLFVFRGLIAALLPLFVGSLTIVATLSLLRLINVPIPLSIFALNMTVALGLGLAIDYSLFIVSRYREELAKGLEPRDAISQTIHTAGKTVVFSAMTVAVAITSLGIFPQQFLYSMAIAGSLTAVLAALISVTALPAILLLLGHRINSFAPKRLQHKEIPDGSGPWYHLARWVMKRAVFVTLLTSAALLVAGLPFLRIEFTGIDTRTLPADNVAKKVDDVLRAEFSNAGTEPISIVIQRVPDENRKQVLAFADKIGELPGVKSVSEPRSAGPFQMWQLDVNSLNPVLDDRTLALVEEIRALPSPGEALVAGQSARFVDQQAALAERLPFALIIIGGATLVILFLMTGSLLIPLKSILMNALSISAAFGILVWIFQDGRFEGLLAYDSLGGLESTQPLLLLALAFGLSTDYGVFLLTRIKEAHDSGMSNEEAVALGVQRTGRIITAAAILFCVTIGAFATSKIIFIKQVGVGTAAAVLIDATIIRALLVPALMKLLGEWNWWAPGPLRRLHEKIGIDEMAPALPKPRSAVPAAPPSPAPTPPPERPL